MFTTYVLYSPSHNKIYIGFTSSLQGRLESHNIYAKKGWTIKFRPWELLYFEEFETKGEAMQREKELKSARGREFIWHLVGEKYH
ncbi:MAG: GIY-YIG nuclease family protein [Bacteroidales bacterium]|nr:GIY-YIG nuclease family protein [Bacteroidales bacterium]